MEPQYTGISEQSEQKCRDYLTTLYSKDQQVPEQEQILFIQKNYIKNERHAKYTPIIVGLQAQINQIMQVIDSNQQLFSINLLLGSAGTGKTMTMKYISRKYPKHTFIHVPVSDLASMQEQFVEIIFKLTKFYQPSVLIFDELDFGAHSLPNQFEKIKKWIKQFKNIKLGKSQDQKHLRQNQVTFFAIANNPQQIIIDKWPIISKCIHFPLLTNQQTVELIIELAKRANIKNQLNQTNIKQLMKILQQKKNEHLTGSDIQCIIKDAAMSPIRNFLKNGNDISKLSTESSDLVFSCEDIFEALKTAKSSISAVEANKVRQSYLQINQKYLH